MAMPATETAVNSMVKVRVAAIPHVKKLSVMWIGGAAILNGTPFVRTKLRICVEISAALLVTFVAPRVAETHARMGKLDATCTTGIAIIKINSSSAMRGVDALRCPVPMVLNGTMPLIPAFS